MASGSDDGDLRERIEQLEATVEELETTTEEMLPGRRGVLKAGGLLAGGGVLGALTADRASADVVGQVGTQQDRVDVFAGQVDANSVNTTQLNNTAQSPERPLYGESKTVNVDPSGGADYTSLQTAIETEAPNLQGGNLGINLADSTYNEDVTITSVHGDRGIGKTAIDIAGNTTTPANVDGLSFAIKNCTGLVSIRGVTLDREHPFNGENSGIIAYESLETKLASSEIGDITHAVISYGNSVFEVSEVDFGSAVNTAMRVKHGGTIFEQRVGGSNITGSVARGYHAIEGTIFEASENTLTASNRYDLVQGQVIDGSGTPRGEMEVNAGEDLTSRQYRWGQSQFIAPNAKKTTSVGTSDTAIQALQNEGGKVARAGLITVEGEFDDSGTVRTFIDVVLMCRNGTATVVSSETVGSPAARSYSVNGSKLQLAMASGTYQVIADGQAYRNV